MFESAWSGLITAYFSTFFKFTGWRIFVITTVYYNRRKSAKRLNRKLKIIPYFGLLPTRLNMHKNKKLIAFYQISWKSRQNKVPIFFGFDAYLTPFWVPAFAPHINLKMIFSQKALYRFFKKSSQIIILYIYDHIPSKNPECSTKKPGGSF